jgi:hypothetical protein
MPVNPVGLYRLLVLHGRYNNHHPNNINNINIKKVLKRSISERTTNDQHPKPGTIVMYTPVWKHHLLGISGCITTQQMKDCLSLLSTTTTTTKYK